MSKIPENQNSPLFTILNPSKTENVYGGLAILGGSSCNSNFSSIEELYELIRKGKSPFVCLQ